MMLASSEIFVILEEWKLDLQSTCWHPYFNLLEMYDASIFNVNKLLFDGRINE